MSCTVLRDFMQHQQKSITVIQPVGSMDKLLSSIKGKDLLEICPKSLGTRLEIGLQFAKTPGSRFDYSNFKGLWEMAYNRDILIMTSDIVMGTGDPPTDILSWFWGRWLIHRRKSDAAARTSTSAASWTQDYSQPEWSNTQGHIQPPEQLYPIFNLVFHIYHNWPGSIWHAPIDTPNLRMHCDSWRIALWSTPQHSRWCTFKIDAHANKWKDVFFIFIFTKHFNYT